MPNSLNLSRGENQPETRTRSHQTSIAQHAGLVYLVDNPEHILQKKVRFVAKRQRASIEMTSEMSELLEWPTPSLGSFLDVKLNLFLDTSVEQIGSIIPERSSLSSVYIIPKESLEELTSEIMQVLSNILCHHHLKH